MFIKPPFLTRHEYFWVEKAWNSVKEINTKAFKKQQNDNIQNFITANWARFVSGGEWPPVFHWSPNTIGYISQESNDWHVLWESNHFVSGFSLNRSSVPASDCPEVCLHWYSSSAIKRRKTYCSAWMQWSRFLDCWRPKQVIYSSCHILLFSRLCMATELLCYVGSLHSIENWA